METAGRKLATLLPRARDADERPFLVCFFGRRPGDNAALAEAWRQRRGDFGTLAAELEMRLDQSKLE